MALQCDVKSDKLTTQSLESAIENLLKITGQEYDYDSFPILQNTSSFEGSPENTPATLAEALLWKMGRWKAYKAFAKNFHDQKLKVTAEGGVVFSAFAKHLQNNNNPIYDQHALRALWAICNFTEDEQNRFKKLLFNNAEKWKNAGSGDDGSCYNIFVSHLRELCTKQDLCSQKLDRLLMPLGKSIKDYTKNKEGEKTDLTDYDRFVDLCSTPK